eukprot:460949_1
MTTRSRRRPNRGRRINPNLPIHSLSTLLAQEDTASIPYSFARRIGPFTHHPKQIDILHLLHDIHALNPVFDAPLAQIQIETTCSKLLSAHDLAEFVTFAVRTITSRYYYGANAVEHVPADCPNWMLLLYHKNISSIDLKLSAISPILALLDVRSLYACFDNDVDLTSLISSLIIIRRQIPYSPLKGIDYRLLEENHHDQKQYLAIEHRHLFGEHLFGYLLDDLCKYMMSFLDVRSFFKCSMINSAWLHFIYRNDTFCCIYKRLVNGGDPFECQLLDHSILSQVHVPNAPLRIGWSLQCDNNSYLDFVTLKKHWFQSYVDMIEVTLQRRCDDDDWIDIKHSTNCTNEIGFDSMCLTHDTVSEDETEYRIKLEMLKPFKSRVIYSNPSALKPQQWMARYNESKARDDMVVDVAASSNRLFHVHTFWFSFYADLLHSMNTNVITDVLKNLRICQNRIRCDAQYLRKEYTPSLFKTLIRYVSHENAKIQLNAMRCLRRIAIQESAEMRQYYLSALAQHGLIRICERTLIDIRNERHHTLCSLREQMLWFIGYYMKSGCHWKSIILSQMTDIDAFIRFVVEEISWNANPKYTASYIWMLSKLFSLHHQTRADDETCSNHKILTVELGHVMVKLMWNSFADAFGTYKALRLEQMQLRRQSDDGECGGEEEDEECEAMSAQLRGLRQVLRDSYYGYSMVLRYFSGGDILEVVNCAMLKEIMTGFDLAIDGMEGSEFALRMVRTSLSCCVDPVFRLNAYAEEEMFAFGYFDKLYAILDAMIAKLSFLIMIREQNIEIEMTMMDPFDDDGSCKQDRFMMLYPAILEAMWRCPESKMSELLYLVVDVAVLHAEYLSLLPINDAEAGSSEDVDDEICCTMAVIWDAMSRYGDAIRDAITRNEKMMDLIEHQWAAHENTVTANQAQSLLTALHNDDDVFDIEIDTTFAVLCPCGDTLKLKEARDCYEAASTTYCYLYCDYCRDKIDWKLNPKRMVYHCDKKENIHPHGFDLCVNCSRRKYILDHK